MKIDKYLINTIINIKLLDYEQKVFYSFGGCRSVKCGIS